MLFPHHQQRPFLSLLGLFLTPVLGFGLYQLQLDLRSYSMLVHFLNPAATGPILRWETHAATSQDLTLALPSGAIRARLYLPQGIEHPPGMVILHGIHHLGIDEPRLVALSRAAAGSGFAVLTPELTALADYHVDQNSLPAIKESPAWLQEKLGSGPVTVVAVSFAGGLALLAARDPQAAAHIRALVLIGAYDDLGRVSRFLATSEAEFPDGRIEPYSAHDYGAGVFVYAHLDQFFVPQDRAVAHEALRDWLWEKPQDAQWLLPQLSPEGRTTMQMILERHAEQLRPVLLAAIERDQAELQSLSPGGKLDGLRVPVYVLHGSADDIIPSTESRWLAKEIPAPVLGRVLITPAFSHVDAKKDVTVAEQLQLVVFLADVLRAAQ